MRIGYAEQFGTSVVVLEGGDTDAEEVIEMAEESEAVVETDDHYLVVRFPGRTDELYTEAAVRGSLKTPSTSSS